MKTDPVKPEAKQADTAAAPKQPSTARVDELIANARAKSDRLALKSPQAAKMIQEANDKAKQAESTRKEAKELREKASAERKALRDQERSERATKRAERKQKSDEKKAAREKAKADKQASRAKKSAPLSEAAQAVLESAKQLPAGDVSALSQALTKLSKERSVAEAGAISDRPEEGDLVEVVSGQFAGKKGTVTRAQRVRCFVQMPEVLGADGQPKTAYLYLSEVKVLPESAAKKSVKAEAPAKAAA